MSDVLRLSLSKKIFVALKNDIAQEDTSEMDEEARLMILKQQYDKGFEDGVQSVSSDLEKDYSEKLLSRIEYFQNIISSVDSRLKSWDSDFEHLVINLSCMIAEKIIKREMETSSVISDILKDSVKKILGANNLIIRVNPSDYHEIIGEKKNLLSEESFSKVQFEQDERIERGGCFIETEIGNVDARISSQFTEIRKNLEAGILE
jgi:flagellar assembly protein FliH